MVLKLRYLGVNSQVGHREYGFLMEDKDKEFRQIVVTIENALFMSNHLMFQEAPDLCYQKLLMDIDNEQPDGKAGNIGMVAITEGDIARYRDSHPTAKARQKASAKRLEQT